MLILGVAGGVASGKSTVAKEFERLGAVRIDADTIGHVVLQQPDVIESIVCRWGDRVLAAEKHVLNRAAIAKIVFNDSPGAKAELKFLESVTHPKIRKIILESLEEYRQRKVIAVVLDAALLFKANWDEFCDHVIYVDVDVETRLQRALQRGWSKKSFLQREKSQVSLEKKKAGSDFIIDNSGTLEEMKRNVQDLWKAVGLAN